MKLFNYIGIFVVAAFMTSCGADYAVEDYFELEELPGYVAFDASGNSVTVDDVETDEASGTVSVAVENPTGTQSDINVNYALGGDAVFGTDYSIAGATASGGSITIRPNTGGVNQTNRNSIVVVLLTDDVIDGDKTLELTLTGASNAEGDVAVGRGGKDFQKVARVLIADVDPGTISGAVLVRDTMLNDSMMIDTIFNPIEGVVITLDDGDANTEDATATTDAAGGYTFEGVAPGTYTLVQEQPEGVTSLSDFDESVDDVDTDGDDSAAGANDMIPVVVSPGGEADGGNIFREDSL